jgi:energy-coupling factor transporter ATP-binding protein EcfA2
VAIAAVVARAPRLWLLDEPHAGLDAAGRDILDQAVLEASDTGATIVLASHETDRAGSIAGRVARMAGGQVVAEEPLAATTEVGGAPAVLGPVAVPPEPPSAEPVHVA